MSPRGLRPKRRRLSDTNPTLLGSAITSPVPLADSIGEPSMQHAEPSGSGLVQPSHVRVLDPCADVAGRLGAPEAASEKANR
jgi:hypothetical protein